jgi:hypothetical protein
MSSLTFVPLQGGPKPESVLEYEKALKEGIKTLTKKQKAIIEESALFKPEAMEKIHKAHTENKTITISDEELFGKK